MNELYYSECDNCKRSYQSNQLISSEYEAKVLCDACYKKEQNKEENKEKTEE